VAHERPPEGRHSGAKRPRPERQRGWWALRDSNPRPLPCKGTTADEADLAGPTESLWLKGSWFSVVVAGSGRFAFSCGRGVRAGRSERLATNVGAARSTGAWDRPCAFMVPPRGEGAGGTRSRPEGGVRGPHALAAR